MKGRRSRKERDQGKGGEGEGVREEGSNGLKSTRDRKEASKTKKVPKYKFQY